MNLVEFKKKIPRGGLMNPGLRKMSTKMSKLHPMKVSNKGKFKNVLGTK